MGFKVRAKILSADDINRALMRIAHEIVEKNKGADNLAIIGLRNRGWHVAARLHDLIDEIDSLATPVGSLDVSFYRDDIGKRLRPETFKTDITFDVNDKDIILVDDVLYTGRTVRAALDAIMDFGRPASIQLAVLIDRGHRELPIRADYVGKNIPTAGAEEVQVHLREVDGADEVVVGEPDALKR
ncbi:MAG: bifunctional pyr operon transcriptional regulator/uracil phosphoribosyltransferase PyrR [Actinomycetota bacterium]